MVKETLRKAIAEKKRVALQYQGTHRIAPCVKIEVAGL